jgi:O-antigen/teichoic acid export membrane protein
MSIELKAISALRWATAAKLVVQLTSWAGTLIVVRLLSPDDYGLMAKVGVVCVIAGVIADLGLADAIVRSQKVTVIELRKIYGVALAAGAAVTALVAASAPFLSRMFQETELAGPIAVASLQIIVAASATVPTATAMRELLFRRLAKVEMVAGVVAIAATLALALAGAAVWSLVLGGLSGAIVRSTMLLVSGERVRPLFAFRGISDQMKFGLTLVGNRLSYHVVVQSDVLIGSAFLSTTEIGQYAVALQLATLPMSKVMGTINQIMLPAIARQQDDRARVRQALLRSIGLVSLVAFPALWGISAVAPELVLVLLGPKWSPATPALTILPLIVPMRMVSSIIFTTSLALGNRTIDLRNTILNLIFLPTGFFFGAHWGLVGLCLAWLVSVPLAYLCSVPPALRLIGIGAIDLIRECLPPAVATIAMYAAIVGLRSLLQGQPAVLALFVLILAGALMYFAVMVLVARRQLVSARNFTRSFLGADAPRTTG